MSTGKSKEKGFFKCHYFLLLWTLSLFPLPINAPKPCFYLAQVDTPYDPR